MKIFRLFLATFFFFSASLSFADFISPVIANYQADIPNLGTSATAASPLLACQQACAAASGNTLAGCQTAYKSVFIQGYSSTGASYGLCYGTWSGGFSGGTGSCPAGSVYSATDHSCHTSVPTCSSGTTYNSVTNNCDLPPCSSGTNLYEVTSNPVSYSCLTTPPLAGADGGPPNPDGSCSGSLVVSDGVCTMDGGGASNGGGSGGGGQPPNPDGSCSLPSFLDPATGLCKDCSSSTNTDIQSGFLTTIATIVPSGCSVPASALSMTTQVCSDGCSFAFNPSAPYSIWKYPSVPYAIGSQVTVWGSFHGLGMNCSGANSTVSTANESLTPVGCPDGQHNDNANPANCVPNTLTCSAGQTVGSINGTEYCFSTSASTGGGNEVPNPNGTCVSPLVNQNGICTDPGGITGGTGTSTTGPLGGATQGGQCGSPGYPPCATDVGQMLGTQVNQPDPVGPAESDISNALAIGNFPVLNSITGWRLPSHVSTCPGGSFDFQNPITHATIQVFDLSSMCNLFEQFRPQVSAIFLFFWSIVPFFMVLAA